MQTTSATQADQSGAANRQAAAAQEKTAAQTAASDFESFLTLLTAQLRHQDPLSPLDSTQFVEQLASFSAVEQQIATNDKLDSIASALSVSDLQGATQWIGKNVEVQSGAGRYEGEPLTFRLPENEEGLAMQAVVANARGDIIFRQSLSASASEFTWDGKHQDGEDAANGDYKISINYLDEERVLDTREPFTTASVVEARLEGTDVALVLSNGATAAPESIRAVRAPETEPAET